MNKKDYVLNIISDLLGIPFSIRYFDSLGPESFSDNLFLIPQQNKLTHNNYLNLKDHKVSLKSCPDVDILTTSKSILSFSCHLSAIEKVDGYHNLFVFKFDIIDFIFQYISLQIEPEKSDSHGRFLAQYLENKSWKYPIIESFINIIKSEISDLEESKLNYGVLISHDIDRVSLEPMSVLSWLMRRSKLRRNIWNWFEKVIQLEKSYNIKSLNFFLSGKYSFARYGNRYSIKSSRLSKFFSLMKDHPIGLHSSYYDAFNLDRNKKEVNLLEEISQKKVLCNRNHYLRFNKIDSIPIYENSGFKLDSTIGFSDENGFRSGICRIYRPWNFLESRPANLWEIPMIYMDTVKSNIEESKRDIDRALDQVQFYKGSASILFHVCNLPTNDMYWNLFRYLLSEMKKREIPALDPNLILKQIESESSSSRVIL